MINKKMVMNKFFRLFFVSFIFCIITPSLLFADDPARDPFYTEGHLVGNVLWRADYKPFGEEQSITGSIENNKKFAGKEKDEETGLYYFGARYMRPGIGRFITVDRVGPVDSKTSKTNEKLLLNPQKLNRYAYGINNPYRYIDPDGRWPEEVHNTIILRAFGEGKNKLSSSAILSMQRGSKEADSARYQSPAYSYMHAMRAPGQTVEEATRLMNDFIRDKVADYKRLMAEGKTDEAYFAPGMAMHPLMDATSPFHEGMQEWKGMKEPIMSGYHVVGEFIYSELPFHSKQERLEGTIESLRKFFDLNK